MPVYLASTNTALTLEEELTSILANCEESARSFAEMKAVVVDGTAPFLYIHQGEIATHINEAHFAYIGSDDATTCFILIARDDSSKTAFVTHIGSIDDIDTVAPAFKDYCTGKLRVDIYISGGLRDKESHELCKGILKLLGDTSASDFEIKLLNAADLNTRLDSGGNSAPKVLGLVLKLLPFGAVEVNPAHFLSQARGPMFNIRNLQLWCENHSFLVRYDGRRGSSFEVKEFECTFSKEAAAWLVALDDDTLLQRTSTTPLCERARFCTDIRDTLNLVLQESYAISLDALYDSITDGAPKLQFGYGAGDYFSFIFEFNSKLCSWMIAHVRYPIIDSHHHFMSMDNTFQQFLKSNGAAEYLPEDYQRDFADLNIIASVHVEAIPDCGLEELQWIESLVASGRAPTVKAIVAQCNLADINVKEFLESLQRCSSRLRGVRYILDYDGVYSPDGRNATHIACSRHGIDYLRDPEASLEFERGFSILKNYGLSFDLQCAPAQFSKAYDILSRHQETRTVIDHLGKPRHLYHLNDREEDSLLTMRRVEEWRLGMKLLASLPNVFVKLSMLGYSVPGWHTDIEKEELLKKLILEVILFFGARRCMLASNFHQSSAVSDSDGFLPEPGPSSTYLFNSFQKWLAPLPFDDRKRIFFQTAAEFYRLDNVT